MLIHRLPLDAALSTLRSTPAGLSRADATARRLEFGPNRIQRVDGVSLPRRFAAQFTHLFAALQRLLPHHVRTQRDGAVAMIPSDDVVPGDVIVLSAGDNVPADCRLLEAFGVRVNNATLTGEALPASRNADLCDENDLLRSRNVVLAGTSLITVGIAAEIAIILLIDYTPAGHRLFGTAPIGLSAWLFVVPFATAMLMLEEARKAFVRRTTAVRSTSER